MQTPHARQIRGIQLTSQARSIQRPRWAQGAQGTQGARRTRSPRPAPSGFTLLELLVTLLLLSVLTSLTLPGFRAQWRAAHRSEGVQALTALQMAQETFRSRQTRYAQSLTELGMSEQSSSGRFRLSVVQASSDGFTLDAQAEGDQARDDRCQRLRLVQTQGQVSLLSFAPGTSATTGCWPQ